MLLACPSCHATFRVPAGAVKDAGRAVRCAKCRHEWHAFPHDLIPEVSAETALKAADAIEKKIRQEEIVKQRHEVEEMLSSLGIPMQADAATVHTQKWPDDEPEEVKEEIAPAVQEILPPAPVPEPKHDPAPRVAAPPPPMDFSNLSEFDFDSVVAAPQEDAIHEDETIAEEEHTVEEQSDEAVKAKTETTEDDIDDTIEETYKVSQEEMDAFASLVSQEELDAIGTDSSDGGEQSDNDAHDEETLDVIEARLALMEAAQPKGASKKGASAAKPVRTSSPQTTLWLSLTLAACILLCLSTAFVTQQDMLRARFPFMDNIYNQFGFHSTKGLELIDMKMTKHTLADKTTYDIEGAIKNNRTSFAPVPAVRIRLMDENDNTMRTWDFAQERNIDPNEKITFTAPKLKALTGTEGTPTAIYIDIGNSLEMMQRK